MLVVHWAKHNTTNRILKNGIRPGLRRSGMRHGVFVYPFSTNASVRGCWRRLLKSEHGRSGNYTENRTSTLKFPQVAPLGPSGLDGRFNSFRRRTQPPSNGPKELRLG